MKKLLSLLVLACTATFAVSAQQYVPVFEETFANCKSTIIQGGYFTESTYIEPQHCDNDGWTSENAYPSERAVKLSTKAKLGYVTSPAIAYSKESGNEIKVSFRAQVWNTGTTLDHARIIVMIIGDQSSIQYVDIEDSNNIVDRNEAPYEVILKNVLNNSKVCISAENCTDTPKLPSRAFISDIVVSELREGTTTPTLTTSAYYHHFADLMAGDDSEVNTFTLTGENLANDIEIIPTEARSSFVFTKDANWDARKGGKVTVKFVPVNAGAKEETFTVKSGSLEKTLTLTGNAKVYSPVALPATDMTGSSFVCNWEPLAGIDNFEVKVYSKEEGKLVAPDLMITKYIEGSSNNRALEIYNGTDADIQLDGYTLRMESNLAGGITANEFKFPDEVIGKGNTYTITHGGFTAVREVADYVIDFANGGYANIVTFTGNDAIGLFNPENELIDVVGYESINVNDKVDGDFGTDKSFYRKSSVYTPSDKFIIEEWDEYGKDYCEGYGAHVMDATGLVKTAFATKMVDGSENSVKIDGLDSNKVYYYTVQGYSNDTKTLVSKEMTVNFGAVDTLTADAQYTLNGNVISAAAPAELYNLAGALIAQGTTLTLPQHGVYILSVNGKSAKIVY